MTKIKYISIGGAALILVIGGSFWLLRGSAEKPQNQNTSEVQGAYTEVPLTQTSDHNSIPLNQTSPAPKASSGLSVASGSSNNNLGQIVPSIGDTTQSSGNNNSAPSSPAAKALDPTTFAQYDKYKDGNAALFGELQVGTGDELTAGKKAAVYYKGWLTDGRLFDMSRPGKDGKLQPFVFEVGAHQVIPGWEQGLVGMKVGGTRLLIVPPAVGYGAAGQDPIPGNSVLIFQVQLLAVE